MILRLWIIKLIKNLHNFCFIQKKKKRKEKVTISKNIELMLSLSLKSLCKFTQIPSDSLEEHLRIFAVSLISYWGEDYDNFDRNVSF